MKKQRLFWAACALLLGSLGVQAQENLIGTYFTNADFSSTAGWTSYKSAQFVNTEMGKIGTLTVNNVKSVTDGNHPATMYCAGVSARWNTNYAAWQQTSSQMSVGTYELTFDVSNPGNSTNYNMGNLTYVQVGGTKFYDENMTAAKLVDATGWVQHTITFSVSAPSTVTLSLGYQNNENKGSGDTPELFFANMRLTKKTFPSEVQNGDFESTASSLVNKTLVTNSDPEDTRYSVPTGWEAVKTGNSCMGVYSYGGSNTLNGQAPPATSYNSTGGNCVFGTNSSWGSFPYIYQYLTLPAGDYVVEHDVYTTTTAYGTNRTGLYTMDGTAYYQGTNPTAANTWQHQKSGFLSFEAATSVMVIVGYASTGGQGSGANPKMYFDNIVVRPTNASDYAEELTPLLTEVQALDTDLTTRAVQTLVQAAVQQGQNAVTANDAKQAIIALQNAKAVYQATTAPCQRVSELIAVCQQIASNSTPNAVSYKTTFSNAISTAVTAVGNATTAEAIDAAETALEAARQTYVLNAYPTGTCTFDMSFLIPNADCDSRANAGAWVNSNFGGSQTNVTYTNDATGVVIGPTFMECWTNGAARPDGYLRQTLSNLPVGAYRIGVTAIASWQADGSVEVTGVSLYGEGKEKVSVSMHTDNGKPQVFTTGEVIVNAGLANIGVEIASTNANWVAVDKFTLTLVRALTSAELAVAPTHLTLSETSLSFPLKGQTRQLTVTGTPANATMTVAWSSDNEQVATVDGEGVVTAVGWGTAHITATSTLASSVKATATVTVQPAALNDSDLTFASTAAITDPGICTYDYDMEANNTTLSQLVPVVGWYPADNGNARAGGVFEYGSSSWLGGTAYPAPAAGPDSNSNGKALGVIGVWTSKAQYVRPVLLEAGTYTLTMHVCNTAGTAALAKNLMGFIADDGTEHLAQTLSYPVGEWVAEAVTFTLDAPTYGNLSIGVQSPNAGGGSCQHLFVDRVELAKLNESQAAQAAMADLIAEAEAKLVIVQAATGTGAFQYTTARGNALRTAINNAKAVNSLAAVEAGKTALRNALDATVLTAPSTATQYAIVLSSSGWQYDNMPMTYLPNDRTDMGLYNIQYREVADAYYAQAFTLTQVEGDNYLLSQLDEDGATRYVSTGVPYGGNAYQIRTVTNPDDALQVKVMATETAGIYQLLNTEAGQFIGSQDAGVYTVDSHTTFKIMVADGAAALRQQIATLVATINAYTGDNAAAIQAKAATTTTQAQRTSDVNALRRLYDTLQADYMEAIRTQQADGADMTLLIQNPTLIQPVATDVPDGWEGETSAWRWMRGTDNVMECWNGSAAEMHFNMRQTLANLQEGIYELQADLCNSTNDSNTDAFCGGECGLYASTATSESYTGIFTDGTALTAYSTYIYVRPGESLTIGVKNVNTPTARWFQCDNFRLVYHTLPAASATLLASLPELKASASATTAMTTAAAALAASQTKDNFAALANAVAAVNKSASVYSRVTRYYESEHRALANISDQRITATYETLRAEACLPYEEGSFETNAEADRVAGNIGASLAKAILQHGGDLTQLVINPSFETGNTNGWTSQKSDDTGAKQNSNATYKATGCDGNYLFNIWKTGYPITQNIGHLPAGAYKLTAKVASDKDNTTFLIADVGGNGGHNAGNRSTDKANFAEAVCYFVVGETPQLVTIGAVGGNGDGTYNAGGSSWYKADDFRLQTLGADELKEALAGISVTSGDYFARGSEDIFARLTVSTGNLSGNVGFCYSASHHYPLVTDSVSTATMEYCGTIYRMTGLQPATAYYVRPYVRLNATQAVYGEPHKVYTLKRGNVGYHLRASSEPAHDERIRKAISECADYWSRFTTISGFTLNAGYNAGVPTAECSYGGYMSFGSNTSYQACGTAMHEGMHGIGFGQIDLWSTLTNGKNWTGRAVTDFLEFWENMEGATFYGDRQHGWCNNSNGGLSYCINGANEDNHSELQYTANGLITQACGEDGLKPTSGSLAFAPAYSLEQEDYDNFYICNRSTGEYLIDNNGTLARQVYASVEAAKEARKGVWLVTYNPATGYYLIKNRYTGRTFSHQNYTWGLNRSDANIVLVKAPHKGYHWIATPTGDARCLAATGTNCPAIDYAGAEEQEWAFVREPLPADVNMDGYHTVEDVTLVQDLVTGEQVTVTYNRHAADANEDNRISVGDIPVIVDRINK